ncbi:MAG: DUF7343 domain-containing protein [Nanobdellota archaeon]
MKPFRKQNPLIRLWLIIGIVAGFATTLFFAVSYVKNIMLCDMSCSVQNNVAITIVLTSLIGVFVGSLTYYFIAEKYEKKITRIHNDSTATLKFLDTDTRQLLKAIIEKKGKTTQAALVQTTRFTRVKISRILNILEQKEIIRKEKNGMTNNIIIEKDIKKIFLPEEENHN